MKLRLHGNSLRLRLTRPEVAELVGKGRLRDQIEFPNDAVLVYELECDPHAERISGLFKDGRIAVYVPVEMAKEWASSERVGMKSEGPRIAISIEKDFQCMHGEKDPDAYEGVPPT
jgi:hypothetical protein